MPFGVLKKGGNLLMSGNEITLASASGSFKICINKYKQVTRDFFQCSVIDRRIQKACPLKPLLSQDVNP